MLNRRAFTLIELLIVVAVIAILAGLLIPTLGMIRSSANNVSCQAKLRTIGLGMFGYATDHRGHTAPITDFTTAIARQNAGLPIITWSGLISNHLDLTSNDNATERATSLWNAFHCPEDKEFTRAQIAAKNDAWMETVSYGMSGYSYGMEAMNGYLNAGSWPSPYNSNGTLTQSGQMRARGARINQVGRSADTIMIVESHRDLAQRYNVLWFAKDLPVMVPTGHAAYSGKPVRHRSSKANAVMGDGHVQAFTFSEIDSDVTCWSWTSQTCLLPAATSPRCGIHGTPWNHFLN
jgi:prepilin-type N-terminal cleavage/methylation domain-containing protein/prepilin-type processing-associated H-X9-DG protein